MEKYDKEKVQEKLNLVIHKLIHLEEPENKEALAQGGEEKGFYKRDFGMQEWDWPQGVGLYGLMKVMQYQKNQDYMEFLYQWFSNNYVENRKSKNINTTMPLMTLIDVNDHYQNPTFEMLCIEWADWLVKCLPRTKEGGFQHVTSANGDLQGVRLNENQIWVDTIFMTLLFLSRMGCKYQNRMWIDEAIHQMLLHIKYLYDKHTGLFYHGWNFNEMDNFGRVFWCRGNCWFTIGSLEFIDMFKGSMNAGIKTFIVNTYRAQAEALKRLQGENGLWHTVLTDPDSYEEVSGSAGITAGILKGVRYGILDDSYLPCAYKAIHSLLNNIDEDGVVLNVSGGTGIGYTVEHYKNILTAPMAYGQSLVILALVEALIQID